MIISKYHNQQVGTELLQQWLERLDDGRYLFTEHRGNIGTDIERIVDKNEADLIAEDHRNGMGY